MKTFSKNSTKLVISILTNLILAFIAIFLIGVRYAVDDDLSMAYQAYGICFDPTSRIMYSNVIIGWLMKTLFQVAPSINWQLILYFVGLIFSGSLSLYLTQKKSLRLIFLWIIFSLSFYYVTFVNITFTVIGAYILAHGFLSMFLSTDSKNSICQVLSGLTIIYGSLFRIDSTPAIILFALACWLCVVTERLKNLNNPRSVFAQYFTPFFITALFVIMCFCFDSLTYYYEKDFYNYKQYDNLRSKVLDNANVLTLNDREGQIALGIPYEVADSLNAWYFNDPDVFNLKLFNSIANYNNSDIERRNIWNDYISSLYNVMKSTPYYYMGFYIIVILILRYFTRNKSRDSLHIIYFLSTLIPLFFEFFWYAFVGRYTDFVNKTFPERIIIVSGIGFWMSVLITWFCIYEDSDRQGKPLHFYNLLLLFVLIPIIAYQKNLPYKPEGLKLKSESSIEKSYSYLNDGRIYVADWKSQQIFMSEYNVWQNPPQDYLHNFVLLGGCEVNHPYLTKKQHDLKIDNPYKALYTNSNVYYLSPDRPDVQLSFLRTVYNQNIQYELVEQRDYLSIYKFDLAN